MNEKLEKFCVGERMSERYKTTSFLHYKVLGTNNCKAVYKADVYFRDESNYVTECCFQLRF